MKLIQSFSPHSITLGTLALALASASSAPGPTKISTKMRDVITHRELMAQQAASKEPPPLSAFEKAEGEDPAKGSRPQDILKSSDFLSYSGMATLIPKHALVYVPDLLKTRATIKDGLKIVTWPDFHAKNRSWITTVEVTRQQAEGLEPLDEEKMESIRKTGDVIVATMKGSPISVLPLKTPTEEAEEETDAVSIK